MESDPLDDLFAGLDDQEPLPDVKPAPKKKEKPDPIKAFREFDRANPKVYILFKQFALEAFRARDVRKIGARLILERIRWEMIMEKRDEDYKINNNFTPFYARKFIIEFPEFHDRFELRSSVADQA